MSFNTIKHNKLKNTGLLFEVLVRRITLDIIDEKTCNLTQLLKKYFSEGKILHKELSLYNILIREKNENYNYASNLVDAVIDTRRKMSIMELKSEKYNLIKEIQRLGYNINEMMNITIPNYKHYANIYKIFRGIDDQLQSDTKYLVDYVDTKNKIVENIQTRNNDVNNISEENDMFANYKKQDKVTKLISYNLILNDFNEKYKDMGAKQKALLKQYINNNLKFDVNFLNYIKSEIKTIYKKIVEFVETLEDDDVLKIKLVEICNEIDKKNIKSMKKVDDAHVKLLLNLYYLCDDIEGLC